MIPLLCIVVGVALLVVGVFGNMRSVLEDRGVSLPYTTLILAAAVLLATGTILS